MLDKLITDFARSPSLFQLSFLFVDLSSLLSKGKSRGRPNGMVR